MTAKAAVRYGIKRGGNWVYFRRVPAKVAKLDGRTYVKTATGVPIDRRTEAEKIIAKLNAATEQRWALLLEGAEPSAVDNAHAAAVIRARAIGLTYRTAADIAVGDLGDLLSRVEATKAPVAAKDADTVNAILGGVAEPDLTLGQLATRYFSLSKDRQRHQRDNTNRNWQNRRRRAVEMAVARVGDKPLAQISRADTLLFRDWLLQSVEDGDFTAPYANKILQNIGTMWRDVGDKLMIDLPAVWDGLKLAHAVDRVRPPFAREFVQGTLFTSPKMGGLDRTARAVVALVASTGLRPIETAFVRPENIVLDAPIPHFKVRDGLKTAHTGRDIPLAGSALVAARVLVDGLGRYAQKSDSLTSNIGRHLRDHGLLPTDSHSLYSLRHTFKDSLRGVRCPEDVMDQLMGHKSKKPAYGDGYPLDVLADWVDRVAFDPPDWL